MSAYPTRDETWSTLDREWDVIVVGGGITGAGILREAQQQGLQALLIDAGDFGGGTSSRSSKLVHGGFRYLRNGQVRLTYESVRERERLLNEGRGLVGKLGFLLANYNGDAIPAWMFEAGLIVYDLLALQWGHRRYDALDMRDLCPVLSDDGLQGGFRYFDAQTDDARLTLRVIREAVYGGAAALNYASAVRLLRTRDGQAAGVAIEDLDPAGARRTAEVCGRVVINATGAWADELRIQAGGRRRLRRLRGSHLVFPAGRIPLSRAVSYLHPRDGRPVFIVPWEGVTLLGTTDVDIKDPPPGDPQASPAEFEYLLEAAQFGFPCLDLDTVDVQAVFSGVRPVVDTGKVDPSKESREHVLWWDNGLLTVTGGKLTTFRLMARDALRKVAARLPRRSAPANERLLDPVDDVALPVQLAPAASLRLAGRHGADAVALLEAAAPGELEPIQPTPALWAELRWAARAEAVVHLDDLLLRRVRLGLLTQHGGAGLLEAVRSIVQPELGWDDARWGIEVKNYLDLWKRCYYMPGG